MGQLQLEFASIPLDGLRQFTEQFESIGKMALGFDHRGRVDVAVTPHQPEGNWLMSYLRSRRIPFFAFRAAVAQQATGAHIHVGPGSTRIAVSD